MKLCSACLLGIKCRYDGKSKPIDKVVELAKKEVLIPVCPEQMGGLRTPRVASGIVDGDGLDVISGKAKVVNCKGNDVSKNYICGAEESLKLAQMMGINEVILKQGSPSCGQEKRFGGKRKEEYRIFEEGKGLA